MLVRVEDVMACATSRTACHRMLRLACSDHIVAFGFRAKDITHRGFGRKGFLVMGASTLVWALELLTDPRPHGSDAFGLSREPPRE